MRLKGSFAVYFTSFMLVALTFISHRHFGYQYFTPKWLLFYASAIVAGVYLFTRREIQLPKLERFEIATGAAMLMAMVAVLWQTVPVGLEGIAADRLGFILLCLFFCVTVADDGFSLSKLFYPALVSLAGVTIVGIKQAAEIGVIHDMPYYKLSSTLGHTNNAAQWSAALLCLVIPFVGTVRNLNVKRLAWVVVFLSLVYIFLTRCRSIWVALAIGAVWILWTNRRKIFGNKAALVFGAGFVAVIAAVVILFGENFLGGKGSIEGYRSMMWQATFRMILDRPLGFGPDRFEFAHLPYIFGSPFLEYGYLARSPHNEFLRYIVEDGVIVAALMFTLVTTFMVRFFKYARIESTERKAVSLLFILFLVESLFQFPFQNAQTVFLFALFAAYIVVKGHERVKVSLSAMYPFLGIALLCFTFVFARVAYSRFNENSFDYEAVTRACEWYPSNWRACFRKGRIEKDRNEFDKARTTLLSLLEIEPNNYTALLNLAAVAYMSGPTRDNLIESCFYLWKHNSYFGDKSPFNEQMDKQCGKKMVDYFNRKRPEKFHPKQQL
jgi:O-antigen ligase